VGTWFGRPRLWLLTLFAATACAPATPASQGTVSVASPDDGASRTIVLAQIAPIKSFGPWQFSNTGGGLAPLVEIHTVGMTTEDARANVIPRLATAMPSFQDGSIVIPADGRMQTMWKLRSDVTWQDGTPFTSADLAFSFAVSGEPALASSIESVYPWIERIDTPDAHTAVITWKTTYYKALQLTHRSFWLYPRHLVAQAVEANREGMLSDPYFTTEYVHLGPFRLADWGLGENVVFERYDGYFLGKPKVGKMVIRVIGDPNAMLAALRAGAVDVIPAKTLSADLYSELADEWQRTDEGIVARAPDNWRYIWFQFDPRWAQPVEISQDVRFRRGFLFGLDRDAIRELIHPGIPEAATNSFLARNDPRDSIVGQPFARYPYDPNRALQEWADAGWRRGADGRLLNAAGQPVQVEIRATDQDPRQIAAMAAGWRQLGVDMTEFITPPAMARDSEFRAKFPAMESRGRGTGEDIFISFDSREASGPENRWSGASNGHYANPLLDRLRDQMLSTVDFERRANLLKEAGEVLATDLPAIPIYYGMMFMSIRSPVKGPLVEDFSNMHESAGSAAARNAHLWERT
jgi:peptide/nickel transport system substrate-binding protein